MRTLPLLTEVPHRVDFLGLPGSLEQMPQRAAAFKPLESEHEHYKWQVQTRLHLVGKVERASEWRARA